MTSDPVHDKIREAILAVMEEHQVAVESVSVRWNVTRTFGCSTKATLAEVTVSSRTFQD